MELNGRIVKSRDDLTEAEIAALPDDHPWKLAGQFSYVGQSFSPEADDNVAELERLEKEMLEHARKVELETHYRSSASGVLERYWDESLDTYKPQSDVEKQNVKVLKRFVKMGKSSTVALCGSNGTGKTLLGCALIREMGGRYMTASRLVYEVDSTMSFKSKQTKIEFLDELSKVPLLVIDEIGRGARPEFQSELVNYLYNERYSRMLPTCLISNMEKLELADYLGNAVVDRLNETCAFLEFNGQSYRPVRRKMAIDSAKE